MVIEAICLGWCNAAEGALGGAWLGKGLWQIGVHWVGPQNKRVVCLIRLGTRMPSYIAVVVFSETTSIRFEDVGGVWQRGWLSYSNETPWWGMLGGFAVGVVGGQFWTRGAWRAARDGLPWSGAQRDLIISCRIWYRLVRVVLV